MDTIEKVECPQIIYKINYGFPLTKTFQVLFYCS